MQDSHVTRRERLWPNPTRSWLAVALAAWGQLTALLIGVKGLTGGRLARVAVIFTLAVVTGWIATVRSRLAALLVNLPEFFVYLNSFSQGWKATASEKPEAL